MNKNDLNHKGAHENAQNHEKKHYIEQQYDPETAFQIFTGC